MRHRFALLALLAALAMAVAGCAGDPPSGSGAGVPPTTAAPAAAAPVTSEATPDTSLRAPKGVVPAGERRPAPGIEVTDFDGKAISLAELRGRPVVVNFFESWCVVCRA